MKFIGFEKFTNCGKAFCGYLAAYVSEENHEKIAIEKENYKYYLY